MKTARFIEFSSNLPYNFTVEHAILQLHAENDYDFTLRIWQNPISVILGRGQSITKEIDLDYCEKHGIEVSRRISGGGAVYNDLGNYNISFFTKGKLTSNQSNLGDKRNLFTKIISLSLVNSGFKNIEKIDYNILYKGKKISGSAGYILKDQFLHHATLLTSANLENLEKSLLIKTKQGEDKKASNYFPTTNLPDFNFNKWKNELFKIVESHFGYKLITSKLDDKEKQLAQQLVDTMYNDSKWIKGAKRIGFLSNIQNNKKAT